VTPVRGSDAKLIDGCHILTSSSVDYLDGAENDLYELISATQDLGSGTDALMTQARNWPERYHLSPDRANVLRPLALPPGAKVLEIGSGCGAITRYLGESCAYVDALEPVFARARVARARTRDLPGVEVFVGELFDLPPGPTYDVIVVIGVLEYVGAGRADFEPYRRFLREAATRLNEGGSLVLAIENRVGVKYLVGAPEDHTGRPFDSLVGYPHGTPARTFTRDQLVAMLAEAGLTSSVLGAFPDYKLTRVLLTDRLVETSPALACGIPQFPSPDWSSPVERQAEEALAWRTMVDGGLAPHTPNSFLILATAGQGPGLWPEGQLAAYYPLGRRPESMVETRVVDNNGTVVFERKALHPDRAVLRSGPGSVTLDMHQTELVEGTGMIELLAAASSDDLQPLLARWVALVDDALGAGDQGPIDLLPHNVVERPDGSLEVVDSKYRQVGADRHAILSRGALITGQRLARLTPPDRWGAFTVLGAVQIIGGLIGLPTDGSWIAGAVVREGEIQRQLTLLVPGSSSEDEERMRHQESWWSALRQPLVVAFQRQVAVGQASLLEAEFSRLGDAYTELVRTQAEVASTQRSEWQTLEAQLSAMVAELGRSNQELIDSRAELKDMFQSRSWKITRPWRALGTLLRR